MALNTLFRWVGSKRRIAPRIAALIGEVRGRYHEPFCGSAAVFFEALPARASLSDLNGELINALQCLRDRALWTNESANDLLNLIHTAEDYRAVRSIVGGSPMFRAARFFALQATSFQGLWRTNTQGIHNVPPRDDLGQRYELQPFVFAGSWLGGDVNIECRDALTAMADARGGDVVYLDPPYADTFSDYVERWTPLHLAELIDCAFTLRRRGIRVIASDSDTPLVRALYKRARKIHSFTHPQSMAASAKARTPRRELLVEL